MRPARTSAIVLAIAASACAHAPPPIGEQALRDEQGALVQLRNRGCELRTCPAYGLSVFADGSVLYIGGANVAVLGERRLKVPNTTVVAVIDALDHLDFLDLPEQCCECIVRPSNAWASKVVLDYRPGAVQKEVVVDDGCPGQSNGSAVMDLFRQIERLVGVESMISTTRASDSP